MSAAGESRVRNRSATVLGWAGRTRSLEQIHPSTGLSLTELLVVLAILASLASISMPGLTALLRHRESESLMNLLGKTVRFARNAAITNGAVVTLCRSENGVECGGSWSQGMIVFIDADADRAIDPGQQVLVSHTLEPGTAEIYWRAFRNRQYLQFTPLGSTNNQNGNFTICPGNGNPEFARQLIINRAGRSRLAVDSDGDGIVEDSRGRPVRC